MRKEENIEDHRFFNPEISWGTILTITVVIGGMGAQWFGLQKAQAVMEARMIAGVELARDDRLEIKNKISQIETAKAKADDERKTTGERLIRLETLMEQQIRQGTQTLESLQRLENKVDRLQEPDPGTGSHR